MVAAVQCGADAVYLGAGDFNARRSADNFGGELDAASLYCHARGAKLYVTLNTLVRQDELSRLEATVEEICRAGVDGAIVQDFGVARARHGRDSLLEALDLGCPERHGEVAALCARQAQR